MLITKINDIFENSVLNYDEPISLYSNYFCHDLPQLQNNILAATGAL